MRTIIITILLATAVIFGACNNSSQKNDHEGHDMNNMGSDTVMHGSTVGNKDIKPVSIRFTDLDSKAASSIRQIIDHYLHVKNALSNDDGNEAASGSKAMLEAIAKLDKSLLTADQKKAFDEVEGDLKEHAEHIGKNGDNIKHQRSHFSEMSDDIYVLVRDFGGGRTLYHEHCPMAKDNQGAMWISESKDIKNPYFGAQMPNCGTVEEVIQ
jgi:hypothetical protein